MSNLSKLLYSPALRMKQGELDGISQLAIDVARCMLPRFIVPPSGERDKVTPLFDDLGRAPDISASLSTVWRHLPALIDVTYILDEFGRNSSSFWLPEMFKKARQREILAIPTAYLRDIDACAEAYRLSISHSDITKFGLVISSDEVVGTTLSATINETLKNLSLAATDCVVIVDFANVEFSEPEIVAPIIGFALQTLQEIGVWQKVIFQGSHFPEKNPAPKEGGFVLHPRNEWVAWRLAVKFDSTTAEHLMFGDYAADCSKIAFADGGGIPIPHLRYTTKENWRIQRDPKSIHQVYDCVVKSRAFISPTFSKADAYIAKAALDKWAPHGNGTTWRQLNTTHHLTQVVSDIAGVRGIEIKPLPTDEFAPTEDLFK
ncbi:MAG: hypothetical protein KGK02_09550 [Rhodospirillales bacterium]|nr:hypothetical protein [Rhodospirillales bacterium]